MKVPLYLSSNGVELTARQEAMVRAAVKRLEPHTARLIACQVVVSVLHRRPGGDPVAWTVRIWLTLPRGDVAITRHPRQNFGEAVDDAFDAARRRLRGLVGEANGEMTQDESAAQGRITQLYHHQGYGFITAEDGHAVYFHRASVPSDGFDRLTRGATVRFCEETGAEGSQASTVECLGAAMALLPSGEGSGAAR